MNEIALNDPKEVIECFNSLCSGFVFRGQADSIWKLESSLERALGAAWSADSARKFEEHALAVFQSKFHLYDGENQEPDSRLEWLALMQHYGAPTRLLDFTESPYVALYFALESLSPRVASTKPDAKLAVFAFNYSRLMDASLDFLRAQDADFHETKETLRKRQDEVFDRVVDPRSYDIAWITEPRRVNKRLDRQAGCFLISGNRGRKLEALMQDPRYAKIEFTKFTIPVRLYPHLFALLRHMNVNSKNIYGDLHGLCMAIRMEMQVYA